MYKTSKELKQEAKEIIKGRWKEAILLNIIPAIASILLCLSFLFVLVIGTVGDTSVSSSSFDSAFGSDSYYDDLEDEYSSSSGGIVSSLILIAFIIGVTILLLLANYGIDFSFLDIIRNPSKKIEPLKNSFRLFNRNDGFKVIVIKIISHIFNTLWYRLFYIPGCVKRFSYSQALFIYYDVAPNPEAYRIRFSTDYITESRVLMNGHKGRLFYIQLSFIGWNILSIATLGIGYLWLLPYRNATLAAFYNDIAKDKYTNKTINEDLEVDWTTF